MGRVAALRQHGRAARLLRTLAGGRRCGSGRRPAAAGGARRVDLTGRQRQLVARPVPHAPAFRARAQRGLRRCWPPPTRTGTTSASSDGRATRHRGRDGEDPHRRVDARDRAPPDRRRRRCAATGTAYLGRALPAPAAGRVRSTCSPASPGRGCDDHGVPYSLTEEFVAVYRMHPAAPTGPSSALRPPAATRTSAPDAARDDRPPGPRHHRRRAPSPTSSHRSASSTRRSPAPQLPRHPAQPGASEHPRRPGRGAAHRPVRHRPPARSRARGAALQRVPPDAPAGAGADFGALTGEDRDDAPEAARIAGLYGDVERVDLMVGLYAEPLLPGFGFSETAFRIFVLMASRRLKSDPFFTDDFRPEVYTPEGMRWIEDASMAGVIARHIPELRRPPRALREPVRALGPPGKNHRWPAREHRSARLTDGTAGRVHAYLLDGARRPDPDRHPLEPPRRRRGPGGDRAHRPGCRDLKRIVLTHAHRSHVRGAARLRRPSGARSSPTPGRARSSPASARPRRPAPLPPPLPRLSAPVRLNLGYYVERYLHRRPAFVSFPAREPDRTVGDGDMIGPLR